MTALYWVWLQSVLGYGSAALHTVLDHFPDAQEFYRQRNSESIRELHLPIRVMQRLHEETKLSAIETIERCNAWGVKIIPYNSPAYPPQLREISNPPAVLYATGKLPDYSHFCGVAMVGTRRATEYGKRAAFSLAYRLARAGCVPVSGIAVGIDQAIHLGSLAAERATVAFLPCGHGNTYLYKRQGLLREILNAGGCLLSELPPSTPLPRNAFHLRNRLISGMAEAVVVVQAPARSGALITANCALRQGKEIFAVTGLPSDPTFAGSYALVRDGATPVFHARDVLEALPSSFNLDIQGAFAKEAVPTTAYYRAYSKTEIPQPVENKRPEKIEKQAPRPEKRSPSDGLSETATAVYYAIGAEGDYIDTLVEKTGFNSGRVLSAVTELEIFGLIRSAAGGKYIVL